MISINYSTCNVFIYLFAYLLYLSHDEYESCKFFQKTKQKYVNQFTVEKTIFIWNTREPIMNKKIITLQSNIKIHKIDIINPN